VGRPTFKSHLKLISRSTKPDHNSPDLGSIPRTSVFMCLREFSEDLLQSHLDDAMSTAGWCDNALNLEIFAAESCEFMPIFSSPFPRRQPDHHLQILSKSARRVFNDLVRELLTIERSIFSCDFGRTFTGGITLSMTTIRLAEVTAGRRLARILAAC
jgi:hypothetical protein